MAITAAQYAELLNDTQAETDDLFEVLAGISHENWSAPTPADGWNIHDQVVHLAFFDELAAGAFTDPDRFKDQSAAILATGPDWIDQISHSRADMGPSDLTAWWAHSRSNLLAVLFEVGPTARCSWFGPQLSAASSATARLMETWAHGQDIYDTLGRAHPASDRLRHVCHLGVITRLFSYSLHHLPTPTSQIRVELIAPSGELWSWGPPDSKDRVCGPAEDFALALTQRRHVKDTRLAATTGDATRWLSIGQAFAGSIGAGRPPASSAATELERTLCEPAGGGKGRARRQPHRY